MRLAAHVWELLRRTPGPARLLPLPRQIWAPFAGQVELMHSNAREHSSRIRIGQILQVILYALLLPIGLYFFIKYRLSVLLHTLRMRHQHRAISFAAVSGGTFILDYPSRKWGLTDLWWTSECITEESPPLRAPRNSASLLDSDLRFDRWCCQRYLHETSGLGRLVQAHNGFQALIDHYEDLAALSIVEINSGLVTAQELIADQTKPPVPKTAASPSISQILIKRVKQLCGEHTQGMISFFRTPEVLDVGPFNLQRLRVNLFRELIAAIEFDACVETGSSWGSTTRFLHQITKKPVYSVECVPRVFGYVSTRFFLNRSIMTLMGDSRDALNQLLPRFENQTVFFYLDAHGVGDLPLLDETLLIFQNGVQAVVMIDDFKVPNDQGYGFDDYGEGAILSLDYIAPLDDLGVVPYFPDSPSSLETGVCHGCVVLARHSRLIDALESVRSLRASEFQKTEK